MTTPVGPFFLTGIDEPLDIPVPAGSYSQVLIDNASPYSCGLVIGSPRRWLNAFTSDLYDMDDATSITLTPALALQGASTDNSITATFYRADETLEGHYPVSLTSQAIVAALAGDTTPSSSTSRTAVGTTPVIFIPAAPPGYVIKLGVITISNPQVPSIRVIISDATAGNFYQGWLSNDGSASLLCVVRPPSGVFAGPITALADGGTAVADLTADYQLIPLPVVRTPPAPKVADDFTPSSNPYTLTGTTNPWPVTRTPSGTGYSFTDTPTAFSFGTGFLYFSKPMPPGWTSITVTGNIVTSSVGLDFGVMAAQGDLVGSTTPLPGVSTSTVQWCYKVNGDQFQAATNGGGSDFFVTPSGLGAGQPASLMMTSAGVCSYSIAGGPFTVAGTEDITACDHIGFLIVDGGAGGATIDITEVTIV